MGPDLGTAENDTGPVELVRLTPPRSHGLRLQHMMFGVGACALLVWLGMVAGLWLVLGAAVAIAAGLSGLVVILTGQATANQESLLWALAIAAERSLPLSRAALAFSDQFAPPFRWRAQVLARLLEDGTPLPEAVDEIPGLFTREAEVLVKTGWHTGNLAPALREAAALRTFRQGAWAGVASRFAYVGAVALVLQSILIFMSYYISPRFQAIFRDFGVALPALTRYALDAGEWVTSFYFIPAAACLVLELALLVAIPVGLFNLFQWDLPLLDRVFRRRHAALVLRSLALTTRAGLPIGPALATLARSYPTSWVRGRLRLAAAGVGQGGDWREALRRNGLLSGADAAVLASAQRVGNLGWALHELADGNERRLGYRLQVWLQVLFPAVMILVGLTVFAIAVAYFQPLTRLIEVLA